MLQAVKYEFPVQYSVRIHWPVSFLTTVKRECPNYTFSVGYLWKHCSFFCTFIHRIAENIYSKNSCDVSNQMEKWELISIKNHEFSNLRVQSDVWFSEISTLIELPHFSVSALSIFWQVLIITLLIGRYNPKNMEIMLIIIIVLKLFLRFLRRKCIQMSRYEKFVSCKH